MSLLLCWIKSQPDVAYKSIFFKKKHVTLFFSLLKNEEVVFQNEFIFVFIWYFIRTILLKKSNQKWGVWK